MMGPTKKKIITTGVVAFAIPVVVGSVFFVNYNKKKTEEIEALKVQSRVIERFVLADNMVAGEIITLDSLKGVQVKAESAPVDSYASGDDSLAELIGKRIRINAEKKTILAKSMLMEENEALTQDERYQEFNMLALPSDLEVGDFVDVRIVMPTGEDYLVVSGKEVKQIGTSTESNSVFLQLGEEEILRSTAAIIESYLNDGFKIYANKYVDPSEQLYTYKRVNYVENFEKTMKTLVEERQKFATEKPIEYLKKYKADAFEEMSGDVVNASGDINPEFKLIVTEDDIETLEIASKIGLTENETKDIRNALKENDETVLALYNDKLITTRKDMVNTYPVKTNIANLIKSNPNILQTIKDKYNIEALEEQRAGLLEFPLYDYNEYGEMEEADALTKLQENLKKEIEAQRTERKEYLKALLLSETGVSEEY